VGLVLFLLFLAVPVAELYVIVQVAGGIGVLPTLALLVGISVAGAWLVKWQGLVTLARFQRRVAAGQLPTAELVDGILVILAGALMLTPGFLTDVTGLLLLLPPVRALVRAGLLRRFRLHPPRVRTGWVRFGSVIDVDGTVAEGGFDGPPRRGGPPGGGELGR
jgi:UPF0716 protein FxsA